jgi:hypothetical protein
MGGSHGNSLLMLRGQSMTTLIAVYNSEGCVGRCDARCYNAKEPKCECICGGANHGAGLQQALDNTREYVERWVEDYAQKHTISIERTELAEAIQQLGLW